MESIYEPRQTEDKIYKFWLKRGYFNPDKLPGQRKKTYCVTMAPPNVTGHIHIGHALENTLVDVLIRLKRMRGYKTLFLPGKDHAGIAAQCVVERELKKKGESRFSLGKEKFLERMWQWMKDYGDGIDKELQKMGFSCDWSRRRFTMDEDYQKTVKAAFEHYQKKRWIYQGKRLVNWCTRCQTNISDLEVEYQEEKSKLWYIRYPIANDKWQRAKGSAADSRFTIDDKQFIVVATTRPETMLGDAAVAVNPEDKRYKDLIGKIVILPIAKREIPIISDKLVDMNFGTGAVKVTPAHDQIDFEIGQRHKLPFYCLIDEKGRMTEEAEICQGLSTKDCRSKVLEILREEGLLEKEEEYLHNVGVCERCKTVIEPLLSEQWFVSMDELAKMAIKAVRQNKIRFIPANRKNIFISWFKQVKDWNISRQLWWGHQLPIWFCQNQTEKNSNFQSANWRKISNSKQKKFVVAVKRPKICPFCKKCKMEQSTDVLDTWFSSALWPFAVFGWPKKTKDLKQFYPSSLITSAREIFFLWIGRMVFSGLEFMKKPPFGIVYIHPTVLDKQGKKMSKSVGNVVDPMAIIEQFGADALRFGLVWQATGHQDIHWDETAVLAGKKFCNKVWNASRFVLRQISGLKTEPLAGGQKIAMKMKEQKLNEIDKKILRQLENVQKLSEKEIENFYFGSALRRIYEFFWHEFCDKYIENVKSQMSDARCQILLFVLLESLKLLHPFMPFITEEIYQKIRNELRLNPAEFSDSIMVQKPLEKFRGLKHFAKNT